jgi:2-iminobutanoate/2-iminopropanoate deaminase
MPSPHSTHDPPTIAATEGRYAHAVEVQPNCRYLFISGQIPVWPDGTIPDSFSSQCNAVWDNVLSILSAAGYEPRHLVKVTTFLASSALSAENGRIRRARLGDVRPALTVVAVDLLDKAWLLEIDAVAAIPT